MNRMSTTPTIRFCGSNGEGAGAEQGAGSKELGAGSKGHGAEGKELGAGSRENGNGTIAGDWRLATRLISK